VEFSAGASNDKNGAVLGCNPSNANNVSVYVQTCDSTGDTGWLVFSFSPTVTPEPVSTVLMGSGLAGLAAVRRRESGLVDCDDSEEER
jgi:hypothetical protein